MLQLELNLWDQLKEAEAAPTAIAFQQLLLCFDAELERMSAKEKMQQGAEAIQQLAELLALRAESYFEEWQQRYDPTGPSLESDDFADLVRQSFSLELEDLITDPDPTFRLPNQSEGFSHSLVSAMSKDDLLELLEDSEIQQEPAIAQMPYDEDVSAWIALVRSCLEALDGRSELLEVIRGTALSPVMVWMALLLGGFRLEKQGDFYRGDVLVG
ncbi:hypothetical protein [Lyngbya confervoides]|uniref:Uncharacterized protein n=1 Tax=Lyngbya confervoides BDU141951 TaxID=1574623 RepID=A0ABD4T233_9CYAN|nr:hypothetical protein [Lyngbya confervoides]MCM1982405.1 hypothetical protein [Lyngbya confervoides BDU141951]